MAHNKPWQLNLRRIQRVFQKMLSNISSPTTIITSRKLMFHAMICISKDADINEKSSACAGSYHRIDVVAGCDYRSFRLLHLRLRSPEAYGRVDQPGKR
jgi:hypothetical protein